MRFIEQVGVAPEDDRLPRTYFRARRLFPLGQSVFAQLALDDLRRLLRPLEFRDVERADGLAIAASDTLADVVGDDSELPFLQRAEHAGADAGGIDAVHALLFHERRFVVLFVKL